MMKCRLRFKKRNNFRKILESTVLHGSDDRPYAKVKVFDEFLLGLLDSGANVSALGKNCLSFFERNKIPFRPFKLHVKVAGGSNQKVIGFCTLPIFFKDVTRLIDFYLVPTLSQEAYFGTDFWREFALAPEIIPCTLN